MRTPQDVLAPLTDSALFLTLTVRPGHEAAVHDFLPYLRDLGTSVGFPQPTCSTTPHRCLRTAGTGSPTPGIGGPRDR